MFNSSLDLLWYNAYTKCSAGACEVNEGCKQGRLRGAQGLTPADPLQPAQKAWQKINEETFCLCDELDTTKGHMIQENMS